MTKKKYNILQLTLLRLAASAMGAQLLAPILHYFDSALLMITRNRVSFSGLLTGVPIVRVTATGAKSGPARTLPLICVRDENDPDRFALIATNFGHKHYPGWYYNLKANPRGTCSIDGEEKEYIAHEATGEEYDRFWGYAKYIYFGDDLYKQRIRER